MIIKNGTIEVVTTSGGGLDTNGFPKVATKSYGEMIDCQYMPSKLNFLGIAEGEPFRERKYSILIESEEGEDFSPKSVRIKNLSGGVVGEFEVRSIEVLEGVGEIRIEV